MKTTNNKLTAIFLVLTFIIGVSCTTPYNPGIQTFDLAVIASAKKHCEYLPNKNSSGGDGLKIKPQKDNSGIVIWQKGQRQDWSTGDFLVFEIYGDNFL